MFIENLSYFVKRNNFRDYLTDLTGKIGSFQEMNSDEKEGFQRYLNWSMLYGLVWDGKEGYI